MSDEQKMPEVIEDGFGGRWVKCKARQCGLHVVRPGKVQCDCDYDPTGKIEMLESTIATLTAERDARDKQVRELVEAARDMLEQGKHDGPCDNVVGLSDGTTTRT